MKQAAAAPPAGDASDALFERNVEAFRRYRPEAWAVLSRLPGPFSRLVVEDGEGVNIELGEGERLYPEPAKPWTETQFEAFSADPDRLLFTDPGHCNLSPVSKQVLFQVHRYFEDKDVGGLSLHPVADVGYAFVFGIGLGYHIPKLIESQPCRHLVLIEPVPEFVIHSMRVLDWEAIFKRAEELGVWLLVLPGAGPEKNVQRLETIVRVHGDTFLDGSFAYIHYASWELRQTRIILNEKIKTLFISAGFFEDEMLMMRNTYANALRWSFNVVERRPYLRQDVPVFVVGSGPSLDQSLPVIRAFRSRAVLISCGTSLGILLKNGLRPDLHVEIENTLPLVQNLHDWKDRYGFDGITLIAANTVVPEVAGLFDRRWLFLRAPLSSSTVLNPGVEGMTHADPLVANAGVVIAATVGFQQIYMFGVDCGRPEEGEHHARDAVYYEETFVEDPNDSPAAGFERRVPGNFGGTYLTNWSLDLSRRTFSSYLERRPVELYQCGPGARIEGARPKASAAVRLDNPPDGQRAALDKIESQLKAYTPGSFLDGIDVNAAVAECDRFLARFPVVIDDAIADAVEFWDARERLRRFWEEEDEACRAAFRVIAGSFASMFRLGAFFGTRIKDAEERRRFLRFYLAEYREACMRMTEQTRTLLSEIAERRPELSDVG